MVLGGARRTSRGTRGTRTARHGVAAIVGRGRRRSHNGSGCSARARMHERAGAHRRCAPQCGRVAVHRRGVRCRVRRRVRDARELDMMAPLPLDFAGGAQPSLAGALGVGIAFGWCLERAGLGSAPKLMGQFTLRDMTVLKVMFSAILTAMLGLFWLSWL